MNIEETTEKAMKNAAQMYFKKHILGKDLDTVLYEVSKKVLFDLGWVLGQCQILDLCLDAIKSNTELLEKLDSNTKQRLEWTILGINEICEELNNILVPILKGFEEG